MFRPHRVIIRPYYKKRFIHIQTLNAVCKRASHLYLSWARWLQSMPSNPTHLENILILSYHPRLGIPSGLFQTSPPKTQYTFLSSPCVPHASSISLSFILLSEYYLASSLLLLPPSQTQIFPPVPISWSSSAYVIPLTFQILAVSLRTTRFNIKKNSTWCSLCVECFVRISGQTAAFALHEYVINWLPFITVVKSVYSAVWTDSLYRADYVSSLRG